MVASAVQSPASSRDRDRDDGAALAVPRERMPAGVGTPGASVDAGTDDGRLSLPAALSPSGRGTTSR
jgi:hypothetical protein